MASVAQRDNHSNGYPHYNIERVEEDRYRITMAVAGFVQNELDIQTEKQTLTVRGSVPDNEANKDYLHQGIASRNFERKFQLADYVTVAGANLVNGLLHIDLAREVPEAVKPRTIAINAVDSEQVSTETAQAA